ncbi:MAG: protein kinase [Acidobacteria bacterium]|nr:protein kinase [Acidobacteriota bacterium]
MIEAGKILQNRYRVEKQIGAGGMGTVYIATDERFGSVVAIKETIFTDEKFRKAFEREARLLNSLRHPALPRVSDHFIEGNGQFLVMEYIDGEDLSAQLEEGGRVFEVAEVLNWADQLLDALEYLHTQEMPVIHRDIKPQNLKLNSRGQIILLDFGLAKGNPTNPESATAAKSVFGYSRNYASIEQIQGSGTDPRSDLYALAATLYHLLTGIPPVDALTRAMNVLSDKSDPLIAANQVRPGIPAGVSRVLGEAMALNSNQRPASAAELRALLARVKDEKPGAETGATLNDAALDTSIFARETQIQTESVPPVEPKQSEIRTATFSDEHSKVTAVRAPGGTGDFHEPATKIHPLTAPAPKKSRRDLAIGAALGLLLAAGGASALYVYKPEVFGVKPDAANVSTEKNATTVNAGAENSNGGSATANSANADWGAAVNTAPSNTAAETKTKEPLTKTETKTPEPKKTESKSKTETTIVIPPDPDEDVMVDEPPDEGPPPKSRNGKEIPPFVWKKMTPQQRRQLRQALEMERQQKELERRRQDQRRPPQPQPPDN